MIGFPFDSHVEYDEDGVPSYDRAISSEPLRKLIKQLFTTGVMPTPSTNMQVSAGDGMNVIVATGFAVVEGCMKLEESTRTLALQAADTTYDRIDTVVLRLNDNDDTRSCDFYVVEGTAASSPVHPDLTRSNSIYEIGLADVFIPANATTIQAYRITDTRLDSSRCGVISSISEFDTTTIYNQVQSDLAEFKSTEQADFVTWLASIKDILDEDTAGHLQTEIDTINTNITSINSNLVNLILDKLYPIGSIYLETTNTNPSAKLGGTWVAYGSSDTYLRLGGNGNGGSNSVTLAANQIPTLSGTAESNGAHTHFLVDQNTYFNTSATAASGSNFYVPCPGLGNVKTNSSGEHTHTVTITNSSQKSVTVEPKYVGVYAWKRTA